MYNLRASAVTVLKKCLNQLNEKMFYRYGPMCSLFDFGFRHFSIKWPYVFLLTDPSRLAENSLNIVVQFEDFAVQFAAGFFDTYPTAVVTLVAIG